MRRSFAVNKTWPMKRNLVDEILLQEEVVRKVARRYLSQGYSEWIDDTVQDVLLKSLERMDRFQGSNQEVQNWMARITRNHCFDLMAKFSNDLSKKADVTALKDRSLPSEHSDLKMIRRTMRDILLKADERDRVLLTLKYLFKCSGKEIGQYTGISENNVPSYVRRAKENILRSIPEQSWMR